MKNIFKYFVLLCAFLLTTTNISMALTVTTTDDAAVLAGTILGSGVTIYNVVYNNNTGASGTFTGGAASGIGIDSGIILTTGRATDAIGPNALSDTTTNNGLPGDSTLDSLIPGFLTNDATILEFDFTSTGGDIFFNYVFASEEYNEWVGSSFNDVFGFFLGSTNIALLPGTTTPVSINNVNGGSNPTYYNNNDKGAFDLEYDGFTDVFTASFFGLEEGDYHMSLGIADAGDAILDSGVFIQGGTFSDTPTPVNPVPEPAALFLLGVGLLGLFGIRRKK